MYYELMIGGEVYKLRLTTRVSVQIEKALGCNPLNIFIGMDEGQMPNMADLMLVFHGMLQSLNHGITLDKAYDIYDKYIDDGHNIADFLMVMVEVFQISGYMPKQPVEGQEKN